MPWLDQEGVNYHRADCRTVVLNCGQLLRVFGLAPSIVTILNLSLDAELSRSAVDDAPLLECARFSSPATTRRPPTSGTGSEDSSVLRAGWNDVDVDGSKCR